MMDVQPEVKLINLNTSAVHDRVEELPKLFVYVVGKVEIYETLEIYQLKSMTQIFQR